MRLIFLLFIVAIFRGEDNGMGVEVSREYAIDLCDILSFESLAQFESVLTMDKTKQWNVQPLEALRLVTRYPTVHLDTHRLHL